MRRVTAALLCCVGVVALTATVSFGQGRQSKCSIPSDLGTVDFTKENIKGFNNYLKNYFVCRSLVSRDVGKCDQLIYDSSRKECRANYGKYMAWFELARNGSVPENLRGAIPVFDKFYSSLVGGFQSRSDKVCDQTPDSNTCKAIINLDETRVGDDKTKNAIVFMKAIKNSDPVMCEKITDSEKGIEMVNTCKGMIRGNPYACDKCMGVEEFKTSYCIAADTVR